MFVLHVTPIRFGKDPVDPTKAYSPGQYYIWLEATEGEKINHVRFEIDGIKYREVHPPYEIIPPEWTQRQTHSIAFQVRSEKQWFSIDVDAPVTDEPDPIPSMPGTPQFTELGGGDVEVAWTASDNVDSYLVTYPANPAGVSVTTPSVVLDDLIHQDLVCIRAINAVDESDITCNTYENPPSDPPGDVPGNPASRPEFEFIDPLVRVTWGAAPDATSYLITRKNADPEDVGNVLTVDLPLVDGDWLCVRGVNEFGTSVDQLCNSYSAEAPDPPPDPEPDPDPPPPDGETNEPAGMTELFSSNGDTKGPNHCNNTPDNNFDQWGFKGIGHVFTSADVSAQGIPNSPALVNPEHFILGKWPEGHAPGTGPFNFYYARPHKAKSVYWRFFYYLPSNFVWHRANFDTTSGMDKGWWMTNAGHTNHFVPMRSELGGGFGWNESFGCFLQFGADDATKPGSHVYYPGISTDDIPRDQWVKMEFLFVANSAGANADGRYYCWMNNNLVISHSNVHYFTADGFANDEAWFQRMAWNPTRGGGGPVKVEQDQYVGLDDWYASYSLQRVGV